MPKNIYHVNIIVISIIIFIQSIIVVIFNRCNECDNERQIDTILRIILITICSII